MISSYVIFLAFSIVSIIYKLKVQTTEKYSAFTKMDSLTIRGVAALYVMLSHYALWMESYFHIELPVIFSFLKQLGGIGVLLFFFLSGYGIYISSFDEKNDLMWLIKRVGKVWFPYLFMKFVIEIINYSVIGWDQFFIGDFLKEITGIDFSDWFIWVIILQYVIFWIGGKISLNIRLTGIFFQSLILMAAFIYLKLATRWYNGLLLFWFGCFVAKYQEKIIRFLKENYNIKLGLFLIGFMGFSIIYTLLKGSVLTECLKIVSGMILGIILITIFRKLSFQSPILAWIGKRSLFIYIIHVNLWGIIYHEVENMNFVLPLAVGSAFLVTEICYEGYESLVRFIIKEVKR